MTKSDFIDWKRHPVTEQVFSQLRQRIEYLKDELVGYATSGDPRELAQKAGAIMAMDDVLNIQFEDEVPNGN